MILDNSVLNNLDAWKSKGYGVPEYDRAKVTANTKANPFWIHFGAGNIFRAFQANQMQNMLNAGKIDRGIVVAEGFDYEIIEKINRPHDDLGVAVTLKADGNIEKNIVGSVVESLVLDRDNAEQFNRLKEIFANDSLQMATFTITEKGYATQAPDGKVLPWVAADFEAGPEKASGYLGKVCALLYHRFKSGAKEIAMVSMDNCSHNGDKLKAAMEVHAKTWLEAGLVEKEFVDYVLDPKKVSYPWTMIDKITPRPDAKVQEMLVADWGDEMKPVVTSKNTYVAAFVNAEECEYLVIEDDFPNGRPNLEDAGFYFTDRETVEKTERMKVCTCLNPLHTCLAVFGCLLGYELVSEEMKNETLVKLVKEIGYNEGLPVVVNPGILSPKEFIDSVVEKRIPNPFMPDTPQRIACDTSQKVGIRFGETIKAYAKDDKLNVTDLKRIPLVFAGWMRYLMGINDAGESFEQSPDPLLETLKDKLKDVKFGDSSDANIAPIKEVLSMDSIFGVNLYEVGLGETVETYFKEMNAGKGAILDTLKKYA